MAKQRKPPQKDPAAVSLGKRGGAKGGRTRAARLTPEQRSRAAKLASQARWGIKPKLEPPSSSEPGDNAGRMNLQELQEALHAVALRYSEHHGIRIDEGWAILKLVEEVGELAEALSNRRVTGAARLTPVQAKAAIADELADVLGLVLLNAKLLGVDIDEALRTKWFRYLP